MVKLKIVVIAESRKIKWYWEFENIYLIKAQIYFVLELTKSIYNFKIVCIAI